MSEDTPPVETFAEALARALAAARGDGVPEHAIEQIEHRLDTGTISRRRFLELAHGQLQANVAIVSTIVAVASGDETKRNEKLVEMMKLLSKQLEEFGQSCVDLMLHDDPGRRGKKE